MKATGDKDVARTDGWFPHQATWGEVVIGTMLAEGNNPTARWEVIDQRMGEPLEYGYTMWTKVRQVRSGREATFRPQRKKNKVTILTQSPHDTRPAARTADPSDAEAIMNLVEGLGARLLATHDTATGEVTCPSYAGMPENSHIPEDPRRGLIEHLRLAHGIAASDDLDLADAITIHGRGHNPRKKGINKGGFGHRHVPEDLSITS